MPQRLLHISDIHLDRPFAAMGCQGQLARRRRQGLRDALRRAGAIAMERECVAITIGGDLFERERSGADTARFLSDTFASWQPLPVLIAPGNHDALLPGSLYLTTGWSSNVRIFDEPRLTAHSLGDALTIWGLAHREPSWQGDPLEGARATGDGAHLALFHGAEVGSRPDGKSVHGPFHADAIRAAGFAAALCGHYHRRRTDTVSGLLYPGTPEPLSFDEEGGRGPVIVEVDENGNVSFEPLETNVWTALTLTVDVGEAGSQDALIESAVTAVAAGIGHLDPEFTLVRIDLHGDAPATLGLDIPTVESRLRDLTSLATVQCRDLTLPTLDIESALSERTARGAFARLVTEQIGAATDPGEQAVLEDALRYGLMALSGAEVGLR